MLVTHRPQPVSLHHPPELVSPSHPLASPPRTPPRGRRPSLSNIQLSKPMNWLSRSSTSASAHSIPSKPIRISEPRFNHSFDILNPTRSGALGAGATVVRTPQEALAGAPASPQSSLHSHSTYGDEHSDGDDDTREPPSPPQSPPLPPVPTSNSSPNLPLRESPLPPKPTRAPPPPPMAAASTNVLRPSLKKSSPPTSEYFPPVPSLPTNLSSSPPPPSFQAVLVSSVPNSAIDSSKIIVSLETSTMTYRTTLSTLTSRPSYLSSYLKSLLRPRRDSDAASMDSQLSDIAGTPDSSFNSIFHNHLTSSGLLPQSSSSIHIFLDRPSSPYAHILSYLRSPYSTPGAPAILPRAVQLLSSSSSRLEALLDLRDEALYLDLDELYKLCNDEIRTRQGLGLHSRGASSSGTSIHSAHTFREQVEYDLRVSRRDSSDTPKSTFNIPKDVNSMVCPSSASLRSRGHSFLNSHPPAGWI